MKYSGITGFFLLALLIATTAGAYPLDGYESTGIPRLEGYRLAQKDKKSQRLRQPPGALLNTRQVDLRLLDHPDLEIPPPDPAFTSQVVSLLGDEADLYGLAVLDLTDVRHPRYAEHRGLELHNPGSVGKLMVALGVFQALADIYPDDIEARRRVLRESIITADEFIHSDHHPVPFWDPGTSELTSRRLRVGDRGSVYTYLDWMLSASANAAASMLIRDSLMMVHFGREYPVSETRVKKFLSETSRRDLGSLLVRGLYEPVSRNGLDLEQLRQGSFFTRVGHQRVPSTTSHANARELLHYLVRLEQGKIVDAFSSTEIKRLLYMTQRRIRYASSPALSKAAVYFKSGSLYQCRPEPGFRCLKYHGNVKNLMNSVAIVESPAGKRDMYYMVVVMSNVLRKNSAVEHQTLGTRIQRLMESYHQGEKSASGETRAGK